MGNNNTITCEQFTQLIILAEQRRIEISKLEVQLRDIIVEADKEASVNVEFRHVYRRFLSDTFTDDFKKQSGEDQWLTKRWELISQCCVCGINNDLDKCKQLLADIEIVDTMMENHYTNLIKKLRNLLENTVSLIDEHEQTLARLKSAEDRFIHIDNEVRSFSERVRSYLNCSGKHTAGESFFIRYFNSYIKKHNKRKISFGKLYTQCCEYGRNRDLKKCNEMIQQLEDFNTRTVKYLNKTVAKAGRFLPENN